VDQARENLTPAVDQARENDWIMLVGNDRHCQQREYYSMAVCLGASQPDSKITDIDATCTGTYIALGLPLSRLHTALRLTLDSSSG
jgi:hypothetical protein